MRSGALFMVFFWIPKVQKRFSWFSGWIPKVHEFVDLVDLVKNFLTSAYLQESASIQPRAGLSKLAKISQQLEKS